jgi:hypothetical protein
MVFDVGSPIRVLPIKSAFFIVPNQRPEPTLLNQTFEMRIVASAARLMLVR